MKRVLDAARWWPTRRHRAWVRGLRLGTVGRRERAGVLTLRYLSFGRRSLAASLAIALNLTALVRMSFHTFVGQLRFVRHKAPAAGSVSRTVLSSILRSDASGGGRHGSVSGSDESAELPARFAGHVQASPGVVSSSRRREVRMKGPSQVPDSRRIAAGLTNTPAVRGDGLQPSFFSNQSVNGYPEPERRTASGRVLKIDRASGTTMRLCSVYRERQLVLRHVAAFAARRLESVSVRTADPVGIGRSVGWGPALVDEPDRAVGTLPVRHRAARDRHRESTHERVEIRPLMVPSPARVASLRAAHPVQDPPALVVRKRSAAMPSGIERPSAHEEREIRQRVFEAVERTVVEVVEQRFSADSRLGQRLTGQIRSQLYQDLVLERERLGVV